MMKTIATIGLCLTLFACNGQDKSEGQNKTYPLQLSEAEWKEKLSAEEFNILREKGTERAFTGDLLDNKQTGVYTCAGCDQELFTSDTKFKSGTGWPSFYDAVEGNVVTETDRSYGMVRKEILCSNCGGHLGHVFDDGPEPTGLRYCVNSASLDFETEK